MKKILTVAVLALSLTVGCALSSFTKTGTSTYPPLAENAPVDVILRSVPNYKVDVIGVVNVKGGTTASQIEKAQAIARENGGDVIVLTETGIAYNQDGSSYEIRTFEVAKRIDEPAPAAPAKGKAKK
ncbi:hypothetical protein EHQ27_19250 [Leptospira wolffii]|uniref:hypothetical protein n=1 Tax=Leptospira wolffii TaxID=409998 RepID=UPI00030FBAB2|nr:hypothetical protein [Leptospira wolffii]EPG64262.1 putative lipoprotein [Leptospira wolffii serovar Khorat str. Khorat-H2]TGK62682.1 hypothetical protein EHQ32_07690 [Leptospira wolffii]TGK65656.1 hypothetical protein EHQ27_19250 [Leptospira wolffii]TGK73931.1 hypothetical protein EHQ35_06075 [Leptospira wolffii]TGL28793.1 hypothetical protein EHQ57_12600 [Leptospira wolffii]